MVVNGFGGGSVEGVGDDVDELLSAVFDDLVGADLKVFFSGEFLFAFHGCAL